MAKILVLGIGNSIFKDEGIGVHIVKELAAEYTLDDVEFVDGGTASLDLLDFIEGKDKVIIIDAVRGGGVPGTIYRFKPTDIEINLPLSLSLHQVGLMEVLGMLKFQDPSSLNRIILFGIEPKEMGWGLDLSSELQAVKEKVKKEILKEINSGD
ncbi:HyaD/HybD family hydrogenase maturation endopeptidase [Carboxydothermus pertinax]|uniref:Hydrogenase maturation protease n=1 Tax=Carboxydothermus pertinax TaxID=870242 RepID=A0A1L8CXX4_9THEO|nr:HyaD/HybD family hydrogenase maturation endopeptidase [Carboxydothermus pertinax]GAV23785.1 hydrogenase maturation protease [Carboxydothermus pertinax]